MRRSPPWPVRDPIAHSGLLFAPVAALAAVAGAWATAGAFGGTSLALLAWGWHRTVRDIRDPGAPR